MKPHQCPGTALTINEPGNGKGYWIYEPCEPAHPADAFPPLIATAPPRFEELPAILEDSMAHGSTLLEGKPGAGKSNMFHDIESMSIIGSVRVLRVALHINAGHTRLTNDTRRLFNEFADDTHAATGGLILLDNVDYVGYRGKSRSRASASRYAEEVVPVLQEVTQNPNLTTLGSSHTDAWRQNRWAWQDDAIDRPAEALLGSFNSRIPFVGQLTDEGVAMTIADRMDENDASSPETARQLAAALTVRGLTQFVYANHIDLQGLLHDPDAAIARVEKGRSQRNGDCV